MLLFLTAFFGISLGCFSTLAAQGQATITPEVTVNGYTIKKQVSNSTVPSGVVFTYTIFYTIPAGSLSIAITDQVPATLVIDNVIPGSGCGTPTITTAGNLVTYALASVSSGCSGTFQINVHFPAGTTCPGTAARNQVCIQAKDLQKQCTEFVTTTATAANPFGISKGVNGLSWNPQNNGCQYIMTAGSNVTYTLMVYKNYPYQGNSSGQINLNSAIVTDVLPAGATLVSSTCGITQSGNTLTWTLGNLNAASPWFWQSCNVTINYPAGSFPINTQISNTATLSGTNVCNQAFSSPSNTTCIQVAAPISSGVFSKSVYLNNKMPGCQGIYYLTACNNGNTPLTFNIQDALPSNVTLNAVAFSASAPVTATATYTSSATNVFATSATGSVNWTVPGGNTVSNLQFAQSSLSPGACLQIQLYFTINSSVAPNTTITNCANLTSTQIPAQQSCVSFVTTAPAPSLCLFKDICSPQVNYLPGQTFRYRLRVQNIGSANATGFNLTDVLDPNLIYVGNQIAYSSSNYNPPCGGGSGTTVWAVPLPTATGNTLVWSGLNIPANCQNFYYPNCGAYGTQGVPFYYIEFDVKVAPDAASGIVPNSYTGAGGNVPTTQPSNVVNVVVNVTHGTELTKEVSANNSTWGAAASITAGAPLWYRLNFKNTGTGPLYDVRKVDLLPQNDAPNDWKILNRAAPRGSQFGVNTPTGYAYAVLATPAVTGTANTMAGNNLKVLASLGTNVGTTSDTWPYAGSGNNLGIAYGAAYALSSAGTLQASFKTTSAANAQVNQQVCNDFAARGAGKYIINSMITYTPLTAAASNVVCAAVVAPACCEKTKLTQVDGKCCVNLSTECEVKQLQVQVQGGVISSASWNCPASLGSYLGQSNYSFNPNNCIPVMTLCFDPLSPNTSGNILVTVTLYFANGEKCVKEINIQGCKSTCCEKTKVTPVQGRCCVNLTTECEVKLLDVQVQGGVISSASWNCPASLGAYQGQSSFGFTPNNCAPQMTLCFDAAPTNTTGIVLVTFTIYFSNGEKCVKEIKIQACKTKPSDCCGEWKLTFKNGHNKKIGIFDYVNPSSKPICSISIQAAAGLSPGYYSIDGAPALSMTSVAVLTLSPPAVNDIKFWVAASMAYSSAIILQVNYCDGTYCRDTLKWKSIFIDHGVSVITGKIPAQLHALQLSIDPSSKYRDEVAAVAISLQSDAAATADAYFFATSAGRLEGEELHRNQSCLASAWMSATTVYVEFPDAQGEDACPQAQDKSLAIVIGSNSAAGKLPPLTITYFNAAGDVMGNNQLSDYASTSVTTAIREVTTTETVFAQVNLFPNPTQDLATLTYSIGTTRELRIDLFSLDGKLLQNLFQGAESSGFHQLPVDTSKLPAGTYLVRLQSDNAVTTQRLAVVK